MTRQEREGRRKQLRAAYLTTTIKGMNCTEICDLINYSDAEITDLRAEVERLTEMVKNLATSMVNVQQGARDMVSFSDDRALKFKHERDNFAHELQQNRMCPHCQKPVYAVRILNAPASGREEL